MQGLLQKKISTTIALAFIILLGTLPLVYFFNYKVDEIIDNNVYASTDYDQYLSVQKRKKAKQEKINQAPNTTNTGLEDPSNLPVDDSGSLKNPSLRDLLE